MAPGEKPESTASAGMVYTLAKSAFKDCVLMHGKRYTQGAKGSKSGQRESNPCHELGKLG